MPSGSYTGTAEASSGQPWTGPGPLMVESWLSEGQKGRKWKARMDRRARLRAASRPAASVAASRQRGMGETVRKKHQRRRLHDHRPLLHQTSPDRAPCLHRCARVFRMRKTKVDEEARARKHVSRLMIFFFLARARASAASNHNELIGQETHTGGSRKEQQQTLWAFGRAYGQGKGRRTVCRPPRAARPAMGLPRPREPGLPRAAGKEEVCLQSRSASGRRPKSVPMP